MEVHLGRCQLLFELSKIFRIMVYLLFDCQQYVSGLENLTTVFRFSPWIICLNSIKSQICDMSLNIGFSLLLPLNVASCAKTGSSRDNCVQSENLGRRCFFDLLIAVQRPQLIPLCSGIDIQLYFSVCICAFVQCSIQYKHEQCTQEFCWPEPLSTQVGANSFGPLHDLCPDLACLGSIFNLSLKYFLFVCWEWGNQMFGLFPLCLEALHSSSSQW